MQPGTRIGEYEMIRQLGVGGMAEVWLARHPNMNRNFAIKFILPHLAANRDIQMRFSDEAWRQSGLHHLNIAQILTVIIDGGQNYIVMEHVESGLDKQLKALEGKPLPISAAIDIALQVLDALEYTHTLPTGALIHRDIKPSNILIKADGSVRLTDFGIALATNEARRTMVGQAMGTALYMSPEQIASPSRVGLQTDIYSFGCVLYEMLTGRPPFGSEEDTDFVIQSDHVHRMPEPLRKFNEHIPERFEWIVLKALAKDPKFRFQSCREMAGALVNSYREEGLPVEMLRSYRGGLTSAWQQPYVSPAQPSTSRTVVDPIIFPPLPQESGPHSQQTPPDPGSVPWVPARQTGPQSGGVVPPATSTVPPLKPRRWYATPLPYAILLLLIAVAGTGFWWFTRSEVILRLEGSTSLGEKLIPAMAAEFLSTERHASDVKTAVTKGKGEDGKEFQTFDVSGMVDGKEEIIRIVSNGSGKAFSALEKQKADLGMSSRPYSPKDDPPDLAYLAVSNSNEHVIALDGIAVIINNANRVPNLSLAQLKGIFTGAVTSWGAVNGIGGRIHCYGRTSDSGTYEIFRNKVVGKDGSLSAVDKSDQFKEGKDVVDRVARDSDGIGYVTFTQAKGVHMVAVSDVGTMAMYPNPLTVSTEDYVLTRRLYLYQPRDSGKMAADFITFTQGAGGQAVVSSNDFVTTLPKVFRPSIPDDAPVDYKAAVRGFGRLGVSFHFTSGNSKLAGKGDDVLDSLAEDNILKLRTYRAEHPNDEIRLLGFTDNQPSSKISNKDLSIQRATSVKDELWQNGIPTEVYGLAAEMPVADNNNPQLQAKNRRVEVWVRSSSSE